MHPGYGNHCYRRRWQASAVAPTGFFVRGGFTFSGQGGTAPLCNHRCSGRVAWLAVTGKQGGFGRLFCPWQLYVSRFKWRWGWVAVSPLRQFPV